MTDPTPASTRTPWHLWVVGVVALLWNAVGAVDFSMTQLQSEAYLKEFTPEQRDYFINFPFWGVIAWGVGTLGSVVASLLLLLRRSIACHAFAAALAGALITFVYSYGIADGLKIMGDQATGALIFCFVIIVIAVLLLVYARAMRKRGVLR